MGIIIKETIDIKLNEEQVKETLLKLISLEKKNGKIYITDIDKHTDPLLRAKSLFLLNNKYTECGQGREGIHLVNRKYKSWYTIPEKSKALVEKQ